MAKRPYSYSQVNAFNRCMWMWYAQYRRGLERIETFPHIDLGSAVHAGMAAYFKGGIPENGVFEWADKVDPEWATSHVSGGEEYFNLSGHTPGMVEDTVIKAIPLVKRAIEKFGIRFEAIRDVDGPIVEREYLIPISRFGRAPRRVRGQFKCVIDLVAREIETGRVFVIDFKTRSKLSQEPTYDFDVQTALYQCTLMYCGVQTHGSLVYQIRSELPQKPILNKNGTMSRSLNLVTDWDTYRSALVEAGLSEYDYEDVRLSLQDRRFEREIITHRSEETLMAIWDNFYDTVTKIQTVRYNTVVTRDISQFNCPGCQYRELCMAELEGQSTEQIIKLYKARTK